MGERCLKSYKKSNSPLGNQQQPTGLQGSGALGKGVISQYLFAVGEPPSENQLQIATQSFLPTFLRAFGRFEFEPLSAAWPRRQSWRRVGVAGG